MNQTMNVTSTFESASGDNITTTASSVRQTYLIPWNNPYNVITKQTREDILFVNECILFPILTVFGCTGNIMSLMVLFQRKFRTSTGMILIGLAIADLCYLISNMMRKSSCIIKRIDVLAENKYSTLIFSPVFYVITSFSRVSAWLVVLISIERFIAVAFPMKIKIWVSKTRMIVAVIAIYFLVFFILSPIAAQYTVGTFTDPNTNVTTYRIQNSEFYDTNKDLLAVHNEIFATLLLRHSPVILVILFNLFIIILLQRRSAWRKRTDVKKAKSDDKTQAKITRMLLVVAGVCLFCTSPGSIFLIVYRLIPGFELFGKYHNIFLVASGISLFLSMLNSSVNFIIYILFNSQFADAYKKLFCKCNFGFIGKIRRQGTNHTSGNSYSNKTEQTGASASQHVLPDKVEEEEEEESQSPPDTTETKRKVEEV